MAAQKKQKLWKKPSTLEQREINLTVEPGTKVQISIDVGEHPTQGKVPLTVRIEQVAKEEISEQVKTTEIPVIQFPGVWLRIEALIDRLRSYDLATWLFVFAMMIYLVTRLIGLTRFPIYFFTDEAIQTQSIIDLIHQGYRNGQGILLPTYFRNGEYFNLSLSVYLQWLPYLFFGKSAVVTRATSVFVTLLAALSIGIILRDVFKLKYWWTGTLFLSITPAWFLHSRTAFETTEFVSFYAAMLCAYLLYRYKSPRFLYLAIFMSALSFYSYNPAQLIVPLTAISLLISDWRYHWENRHTVLKALLMVVILALPYVRFSLSNPDVPFTHLHTLYSYWFDKIALSEKITRYFSEFTIGLSPWYWYLPNDRDLPRHLMKDYGHIMIVTLPFALLGLIYVLRNIAQSAPRSLLIAILVSPASAALVQTGITRALEFVIPAAILTAIGLELYLAWFEDSRKRLLELAAGAEPTSKRIVGAVLIILIGLSIAFISEEAINQIAFTGVVIILALQVSGIVQWIAQNMVRKYAPAKRKFWHSSQTMIALSIFFLLSVTNISMLNDVLKNGPLWFRDYGLGGMQYGGFQIFDSIEQYHQKNLQTKIILSPDWTNGANIVARFFLDDPSIIEIGSVQGAVAQKKNLDDNTVFIITPEEFDLVRTSAKFTNIRVEKIVPYPDGKPGFYFIRLRYVDNIDEIFAMEKAARQALRETNLTIDEQNVKVRYTYLDSNTQDLSIALVFDNDPFTLAKTYESNPFVIEMTFPAPRMLKGVSIITGSAPVQIKLTCSLPSSTKIIAYTFEGQGTEKQPQLSFDLPKPLQIQTLRVEVFDAQASKDSKVHIWELKLR